MTIDDVIDAIEQNGLPKIQGQFFSANVVNGATVYEGGCALGQAAYNLKEMNKSAASLMTRIQKVSPAFVTVIMHLNDRTDMTLPEIAQSLRNNWSEDFRAQEI